MFKLAQFLQEVYEGDSTRPDVVARELLKKMTASEIKEIVFLCKELLIQIEEEQENRKQP